MPAQERRTELQALRAEDPRIVVVAAEGDADNQALGGHEVAELLEAIRGDLIFLRAVLALDLGLVEGGLRGDELAAEYRRLLQVRLLAVARLAGAEPVGHGDEFDLGDEVGRLDQHGAFPLARFDALIVADRVGDAAVQQQGEVGQEPAVPAAAGLDSGVEDPAEGALAGPESDHRRVQADGRLILGRRGVRTPKPASALTGPTRPDPTRSKADCDRRPKTSATFCWAITGSIA